MADGMRGWARLWRATVVSYWGLGYALRGEEAFRIEFAIFVLMAPLALWIGHTGLEKAVLLMSLITVLITELPGRAKDGGSAAVHLSLLQVPVVWGLVLFA